MNSKSTFLIGLLGLMMQNNSIEGSSFQTNETIELKKTIAEQAKTIQALTEENKQLTAALETAQRDKGLCQTRLFKQTLTPTYLS